MKRICTHCGEEIYREVRRGDVVWYNSEANGRDAQVYCRQPLTTLHEPSRQCTCLHVEALHEILHDGRPRCRGATGYAFGAFSYGCTCDGFTERANIAEVHPERDTSDMLMIAVSRHDATWWAARDCRATGTFEYRIAEACRTSLEADAGTVTITISREDWYWMLELASLRIDNDPLSTLEDEERMDRIAALEGEK